MLVSAPVSAPVSAFASASAGGSATVPRSFFSIGESPVLSSVTIAATIVFVSPFTSRCSLTNPRLVFHVPYHHRDGISQGRWNCNHCQGFVRITAGCHVVADANIQLLDPPEYGGMIWSSMILEHSLDNSG